jgi:hypothetical protein
MIRYIRFVIRYRVRVLAAVALVTIAAGALMSRAVFACRSARCSWAKARPTSNTWSATDSSATTRSWSWSFAENQPLAPAGQERLRRASAAVG